MRTAMHARATLGENGWAQKRDVLLFSNQQWRTRIRHQSFILGTWFHCFKECRGEKGDP